MATLQSRQQRIVYLVTYSRADFSKIASRNHFAETVVQGWERNGVKVAHWVVSMERHAQPNVDVAEMTTPNEYHFHMAIKLQKRSRWLQVRNYLDETCGIQVNFSSNHNTYYSAYKYATKEDEEPVHSPAHPDIGNNAPKTAKAIATKDKKGEVSKRDRKKKRGTERLTVYDMTQLIQSRNIKTRLELVSLAVTRNREGDLSLAQFIANRGSKAVDEALSLAKEFSEAEKNFARSKKSRVEILQEAFQSNCAISCDGKWRPAAVELLESHGIMVSTFCTAVYTALEQGRGKYRNIYIHGPANTGKTFILSPLKSIYKTFCNPATGSFAWMGVDQAEIVFLNDFRWDPKTIAWADFLQALEGDVVHLPAPKNVCARDIELGTDIPFFATSDAPIILIKGGSVDRANTDMMDVRWHFFNFCKQISRSDQQSLIPCSHCFAKLIFENKSD